MATFHITSDTRLNSLDMDYSPIVRLYTDTPSSCGEGLQIVCDDPEHAALLLVEAAQMLLEDNARARLRLADMARRKERAERKTA